MRNLLFLDRDFKNEDFVVDTGVKSTHPAKIALLFLLCATAVPTKQEFGEEHQAIMSNSFERMFPGTKSHASLARDGDPMKKQLPSVHPRCVQLARWRVNVPR